MICLSANGISAQNQVSVVDEKQYEELRNELDFTKTKKILKPKERNTKKTKKERKDPKINESFLDGIGDALDVIAYVLIGLLIIGILFFLFANVRTQRKLDPVVEEQLIDEDTHIEDVEVENAYAEAVAAGNYRLALRYKFIESLQYLSSNGLIDWRHEKTNRDYANELRGGIFYGHFRQMSHIFEWVWYGNTEVNSEEFYQFKEIFDSFNKIRN